MLGSDGGEPYWDPVDWSLVEQISVWDRSLNSSTHDCEKTAERKGFLQVR